VCVMFTRNSATTTKRIDNSECNLRCSVFGVRVEYADPRRSSRSSANGGAVIPVRGGRRLLTV
jgi:hypothetical protein